MYKNHVMIPISPIILSRLSFSNLKKYEKPFSCMALPILWWWILMSNLVNFDIQFGKFCSVQQQQLFCCFWNFFIFIFIFYLVRYRPLRMFGCCVLFFFLFWIGGKRLEGTHSNALEMETYCVSFSNSNSSWKPKKQKKKLVRKIKRKLKRKALENAVKMPNPLSDLCDFQKNRSEIWKWKVIR